jgi:flagellar basal body-associated protein FliL
VPPATTAVTEEPAAGDPTVAALPRVPRRRQRLLRLALAVGLGLAGVAGLAFSAVAVVGGAQPPRVEVDLGAPPVFYALPEITAELTTPGNRPRYVRLGLTLEVATADLAKLQAQETLIVDAVHGHLRALAPADLAGEAGAEGLRTALRQVTEAKVAPVRLRGLLFTQLLVS